MQQNLGLDGIFQQLIEIRNAVAECDKSFERELQQVHPNYRYSALNFLRYLRLRTFDIRSIQPKLAALGLSSLSHAERHVLANIENVLYLIAAKQGKLFEGKYPFGTHPVNYAESAKRLTSNTVRLLGSNGNRKSIMVTLPGKNTSKSLVQDLMAKGMSIARINCAHDEVEDWYNMVSLVNEVATAQNKICSIYMDLAGPKIRTTHFYDTKKQKSAAIKLFNHDEIILAKPDYGPKRNEKVIFCSPQQVVDDAKVGDRVWFDDGKIGGVITHKSDLFLKLTVKTNSDEGVKLKAEKGINLPDTKLNLPSLTSEDIQTLNFACEHAQILGYSFVRNAHDVTVLQALLDRKGKSDIGLVLKIENNDAFQNLPSILLQAMQSPNIGVMTARGDLAVELGMERLSEVQEEIMWLCEAAFIPNIWATQVLETMAKTGMATRAEISDAAMSVRSECVMLNKGPHIVEALALLNDILHRMDGHQHKKLSSLRKLHVAEQFLASKGPMYII